MCAASLPPSLVFDTGLRLTKPMIARRIDGTYYIDRFIHARVMLRGGPGAAWPAPGGQCCDSAALRSGGAGADRGGAGGLQRQGAGTRTDRRCAAGLDSAGGRNGRGCQAAFSGASAGDEASRVVLQCARLRRSEAPMCCFSVNRGASRGSLFYTGLTWGDGRQASHRRTPLASASWTPRPRRGNCRRLGSTTSMPSMPSAETGRQCQNHRPMRCSAWDWPSWARSSAAASRLEPRAVRHGAGLWTRSSSWCAGRAPVADALALAARPVDF